MPRHAPRFLLIAALLLLLVNYPLLSAANKARLVGGIPLLHLYTGAVWGLGIALLYGTARRTPGNSDD